MKFVLNIFLQNGKFFFTKQNFRVILALKLFFKGIKMRLGVYFLVVGIFLRAYSYAYADQSIYEVVNNEDTTTFSDMVVLGYDIDEPDGDGFTPLMIASALGKTRFVRFLIDNGADVDRCSYNGITSLHRAAQAGNNDVIVVLLDAGANVNMPDFDGKTPLVTAVEAGRRFTVELLVARRADVNTRTAKGETVLAIAEKKRFKEIADFLRLKGARK